MTTLPSSCGDCLEILESQPPGTLRACPDLYKYCCTFTFVYGLVRFDMKRHSSCQWVSLGCRWKVNCSVLFRVSTVSFNFTGIDLFPCLFDVMACIKPNVLSRLGLFFPSCHQDPSRPLCFGNKSWSFKHFQKTATCDWMKKRVTNDFSACLTEITTSVSAEMKWGRNIR